MKEIDLKGLIIRILIPAIAVSSSYLLIGSVCDIIPHILLFSVVTFAMEVLG
ncbi:MAG: hypothetical protein PUD20_09365 [bacterium]|nr:hypothetical protein [bacterium]